MEESALYSLPAGRTRKGKASWHTCLVGTSQEMEGEKEKDQAMNAEVEEADLEYSHSHYSVLLVITLIRYC